MGPTPFRLLAIVSSVLVLGGAECDPSGAQFSPATGVLTWNGTAGGDLVEVSLSGGGAIVLNGGQIPIQGGVPTVANTTRIVLNGRDGSDYLEIDPSVGEVPARLVGGAGADTLVGGAGPDEVVGGPGIDVALLGDGDDRFVWNPGDEADTVEGEAGFDTLASYGDQTDEDIGTQALNGRVQWVRGGPITTDLGGVEAIEYFARGGADEVVVYELTGGEVTEVRLYLGTVTGAPDGQLDTVYVFGSANADQVELAGDAAGVALTGLPATIEIQGQDPTDRLTFDGRQGADVVFSQIAAGALRTVFNGHLGDDLLLGGPADEEFIGGDGGDSIGMGGGDDVFTWNPGDDSDLVDGGEGFDTLLFNGSNANETFDVSALGPRVRFFRDVASVWLELDAVESVDLLVRGGGDMVRVNDLSGTDLIDLNVDLAGLSGPDGAVDHVAVLGTPGDDTVQVFGDASLAWVSGLATQVSIANGDGVTDYLTVATFGGDDVIYAVGLTVPGPTFTGDGGDDDDVLIGGDGADVLLGGEGDDLLQGGPGLDVLDGGPGSNVVLQ